MSNTIIRKYSYGEVGIDTDASPGNGPYYIKHYASGADVCGFDSEDEAMDELIGYVDWYEGAEVAE